MPEKIVQLNEEVIKGQLKELVRGSVEETLNELLEAEANKLTQAARYERNEHRHGKPPVPDRGGVLHPLHLAAGFLPHVTGRDPLPLPGDEPGLSAGALCPGTAVRQCGGTPPGRQRLYPGHCPGGQRRGPAPVPAARAALPPDRRGIPPGD